MRISSRFWILATALIFALGAATLPIFGPTGSAQAACVGGTPNGAHQPGEECDDGNTNNNDGCSSTCTIEPGFECFTSSLPTPNITNKVDWPNGDIYNVQPDWRVLDPTPEITNANNPNAGIYLTDLYIDSVQSWQFYMTTTNSDDDFIGFAIGFSAGVQGSASYPVVTHPYLLFKWKQAGQTKTNGSQNYVAQAGLRMYLVDNLNPAVDGPTGWELWESSPSQTGTMQRRRSPMQYVYDASNNVVRFGTVNGFNYDNTGWADSTTYYVQIDYSDAGLKIWISTNINNIGGNNTPALDIPKYPGFPSTGRFGLFVYSQTVTYGMLGPASRSICTPTCDVNNPCPGGISCTTGGYCTLPTCTDGIKNGTETGVDCGGDRCPKCNCDPSSRSCNGNDLLVCRADGSQIDTTNCQFGCNATRLECNACTPNAKSCNGNTLMVCNADGSGTSNQSCSNGCNATRLECNACTPNAKSCNGNNLETCKTDGSGTDSTACPNGCNATRLECNACTPNAKSCNGNNLETCKTDGSGTDSTACPNGCNATRLECNACTPNAKSCNGNNLETCKTDGSGTDSTACPNGCNATRLECNACTPNAKSCNGNNLETCKTDGSGTDSTACPNGCNATRLECNACTPNAKSCNGNNLETCKTDGSGTDSTTCPNGCNGSTTPAVCNPSCDDVTLNGKETDVDCGGDDCRPTKKCGEGKGCQIDADCLSNKCDTSKPNSSGASGTCLPGGPSCDDVTLNGKETDVDCGGDDCRPTKKCGEGKGCQIDADCLSNKCDTSKPNSSGASGTCLPGGPSCDDVTLNGKETDVDCGGDDCRPTKKCGEGKGCQIDADCLSNKCDTSKPNSSGASGTCVIPPTCGDGTKNGDETDTDCGGSCPQKCETDKGCKVGSDCQSGVCKTDGTCAAPTCDDGVKNGDETDKDCGGSCPKKCKVDEGCTVNADCASGNCDTANGVCLPPDTCINGVKDGDETDVDCGGSTCAKCDDGQTCKQHSDCKSGNCSTSTGRCFSYCPNAIDPSDCDLDGIPNIVEDKNRNGVKDADEWDWNKADTDDDGLPDGIEDANKNGTRETGETNPLVPDTDGDGVKDGDEDKNKNGLVDKGETDPRTFNELRVAGGGPKACSLSETPASQPSLLLLLLACLAFVLRIRRSPRERHALD